MVMPFNLSLIFLVVLALAGTFASPLPGPVAEVGTSYPPIANLIQSNKEIQTQVEDSLKYLIRTGEWTFGHMQKIVENIAVHGLVNLTNWYVDLSLRLETFTLADGSHFPCFLPLTLTPELEAEYRTTAISVSKLLRNLKSMKRADALITQTARQMYDEIEDLMSVKNEEKFRTSIIQKYFEKLNYSFADDSELGVEYKKQFAEATEVVKQNPAKTQESLIRVGNENQKVPRILYRESFLQDKVTFRQVAVNKVFLKKASKNLFMAFSQTEHKRFLLANALIQKATSDSSNKANKINEIYQQALAVAGDEFIKNNIWVVGEVLFKAIEKGLESEPTLQKEIQVSMNEIDTKTVYDIDLLHVDFSFI